MSLYCFSIYESLWFAERDERLASYALIARAAADTTVPFLVRLFSERFSLLSQVIKLVLTHSICYKFLFYSETLSIFLVFVQPFDL